MNANEIADKLEQGHWEGGTREQAATMLRQQAEQINNLQQWEKRQLDVLEALKKEAALQRLSDFTQEADNEPVAWMLLGLEDRKPKLINLQVIGHLEGTWIPLYTYEQITPSGFLNASKPIYPAKTLTDEEIYEVWKKAMQEEAKIEYSIYATQLERQPFLYFARAILRKAQEK